MEDDQLLDLSLFSFMQTHVYTRGFTTHMMSPNESNPEYIITQKAYFNSCNLTNDTIHITESFPREMRKREACIAKKKAKNLTMPFMVE